MLLFVAVVVVVVVVVVVAVSSRYFSCGKALVFDFLTYIKLCHYRSGSHLFKVHPFFLH